VHRLEEAAGDGKAEPGARPHPVALGDAMELVEDALEVGGRDALAFVEDAQLDEPAVAAALDAHRRALGRELRCVVENVEQRLLEEHRIDVDHGEVGLDFELDSVMA
jgi:hypothetical protein